MESRIKPATAMAGIILVSLALGGLAVWYMRPHAARKLQIETSDAKVETTGVPVAVGTDSYIGYGGVKSPLMREYMRSDGFALTYTDDKGAYAERLEKFANKEYFCITVPVNSYLLHGGKHGYPGVIVAALCESAGADGIVARAAKLKGKIGVNSLDDPKLKIAYTADSPSSFLLDLLIGDFHLERLKGSKEWRLETESSAAALELLEQGKADGAVLWEPDLAKAKRIPGVSHIVGSERFEHYIIDTLVFHRDVVKENPELVHAFLKNYFRTMEVYSRDRERMLEDFAQTSGVSSEEVAATLPKVKWFDLERNCRLEFGIKTDDKLNARPKDMIVKTIRDCTSELITAGKLQDDPLKGQSSLITNRQFLTELATSGVLSVAAHAGTTDTVAFAPLSPAEWAKRPIIGNRAEKISFVAGEAVLSEDGKKAADAVAALLKDHYPKVRVIIQGHTGVGNTPEDEEVNKQISTERAEAVKRHFVQVHGMSEHRFIAKGLGGTQPPPQLPTESDRSYRNRLPRVEFAFVEGDF